MDRREFLKRSGQVAMVGVAMQGVASAEVQAPTPPTANFKVEVEYEWDAEAGNWNVKTKINGVEATDDPTANKTPDPAHRVFNESVLIAVTKTNPTCQWVWNSVLGRWVWRCV